MMTVVGEARFRNPIEIWKDRPFELDLRMAPSRFGQKSFRRIEAHGRIASSAEPGGVTTAAATDIRSGTGNEKPLHHVVQIDRCRLGGPIVREGLSIQIIGTQCRVVLLAVFFLPDR
jgi:hypothetical protein